MKHHLRFRHGKTEGEANSPLSMALLAIITIACRFSPLIIAVVAGYFGLG
ncbi:hypothetical protein G6N76_09870 [Rhizobium daejeonense]|uniref:Uncharacterized protein n=1 Tax=Rhizobium daejeonense TaxID=240521 RepID=A0A6M1S162_9HYPH|nr:hypothetical protein [Rhizobium daejeonense]NGO63981.1 hypothetical protein [Rhizobium daejeonense]